MSGRGPAGREVDRVLEALRPLGDRVVAGGRLGPLTTYRVGGPAAVLVTVTGPADLDLVSRAVAASDLDVLVVGRGSNLLVSDSGFPGVAVVLDPSGYTAVTVEGSQVRAGAAVALPALARQSVEAGLTGFEWAVGVPGSVGGGIRMNAGGHGSDMAAVVRSARIHDLQTGQTSDRDLAALEYGYRRSSVRPHQVVTEAVFGLDPGDPAAGRQAIRDIVHWRRQHQPGGQNAGSVFTNPPGDSAGRLIEAAGLKGYRHGTATVSPKHANFVQADPDGSADDVFALMAHVRSEVGRRLGVRLTAEVRLVGFPAEPSSEGLELTEEGSE